MDEQSLGPLLKKRFFVQVFAAERGGTDQYRSVIFPADRPMEGSIVCEKWHKDASEIAQILSRVSSNLVDVKEVLDKARSVEGWMMKLELTDSEATLLGWQPEPLANS